MSKDKEEPSFDASEYLKQKKAALEKLRTETKKPLQERLDTIDAEIKEHYDEVKRLNVIKLKLEDAIALIDENEAPKRGRPAAGTSKRNSIPQNTAALSDAELEKIVKYIDRATEDVQRSAIMEHLGLDKSRKSATTIALKKLQAEKRIGTNGKKGKASAYRSVK